MRTWGFLTNHARVLLFLANDPGARLRDLAAALGITERTGWSIVVDLTEAGYVVKVKKKQKDGRRNRYQIRRDLFLRESIIPRRTIGELLDLLVVAKARRASATPKNPAPGSRAA